MAAMLHYDSSGSAWSADSSASPITPTLSATSDDATPPPILQAPLLHEAGQSLSALPTLNTTTISLSKSETNISNLAKPFGTISATIRPSPSLSTLQQRSEGAERQERTYFGPHGRRRSNSLSGCDPPAIDKPNSKAAPLAERRRSETSRYLGTDDFKSAFAINLLKLKEREKVDGDPTPHSSDVTPKTLDMASHPPATVHSQLKGSSCEPFRTAKTDQTEVADSQNSMIRASETHGGQSRNVHSSSTAGHLVNLPAEELAAQLERHFNRLTSNRMDDELEARNEVISILAHQMSNQLEVNDNLLHELAALRAAYASLQSSCSDYVDELELLKIRFRAVETETEVERSGREAEDKVRGLVQQVHESKKAFCRLQVEVLHHGQRRGCQNYPPGQRRNSSYIPTGGTAAVSSSTSLRRNSLRFVGGETAEARNTATTRSTILFLSAENSQRLDGESFGAPALADLTSQVGPTHEGVHSNITDRKLSASQSINKPERPPKSAARSSPASPAAIKLTQNQPRNSVVTVPIRTDCGTQTTDFPQTKELQELRQRCAQLELELHESEDSRLASQEALDALRKFISSLPQSDLSEIKLPPLPTDLQSEDNTDEAISSRWHISNLMSRSNPMKSTGAGPSSPYLKSSSIHGSPAFGNAFSGFSLWGRSPVLG